jgi:hypothetical protein
VGCTVWRRSFGFEEMEGDLKQNYSLKGLIGLEHHFSHSSGGFLLLIILLWPWGEFLKRGALSIEDTGSWRVRSKVLTEGSLHMNYTFPNLQFGSILQGFTGHFQGSQIY